MQEYTGSAADTEATRATHIYRLQRTLVGVLGVALPGLLILSHGDLAPSISDFYHVQQPGSFRARDILVGSLIAIGVFLAVNVSPFKPWEKFLGRIAGLAAICVALIPVPNPSTGMFSAHHIAAIGLFLLLSGMCFLVFPTPPEPDESAAEESDRRRRNRFYYLCGGYMGLAPLCIWGLRQTVFVRDRFYWVFWAEWAALIAFAIAWWVKGRARSTLVATASTIWQSRPWKS